MYYRNRMYLSELGRFVSRDPIGYEAGDVSLYRYVGNSPLMHGDPSGLVGWPNCDPLMGCQLPPTDPCCGPHVIPELRSANTNLLSITVDADVWSDGGKAWWYTQPNKGRVERDISWASVYWMQCCIEIVPGTISVKTKDETAGHVARTNDMHVPFSSTEYLWNRDPNAPNHLHGQTAAPGRLKVHYLWALINPFQKDATVSTIAGFVLDEDQERDARILYVVYSVFDRQTLAHEIGHVLGLEDRTQGSRGNLMFWQARGGTTLTARQCTIARTAAARIASQK